MSLFPARFFLQYLYIEDFSFMNFARLASTVIHRSKFVDRPKRTFTFNAGDLVPIGKPFLVYPGDTFKIKPNI
jgi:hypothetical protein